MSDDLEQAISRAQASLIDEYLNGHGQVIAEEAEGAGLGLDLACALVEQESGGRNIFGCDGRNFDEPDEVPFCHARVTAEKVQMLLANIDAGGASNGVGLVQLTYPMYIRQAEGMGGAHRPRFQCRVGFTLLRNLIERYGTRTGLGIYNGGPAHPNFAYAWDVLEKRNEWRRRLKAAQ
jgi:hypothetical protein